jgi:hypothetical protein
MHRGACRIRDRRPPRIAVGRADCIGAIGNVLFFIKGVPPTGPDLPSDVAAAFELLP